MNIASQTRVLRLDTGVINMPRGRNIVLCFILCLQCILHEGSSVRSEAQEKYVAAQDKYTFEIPDWECESNLDCAVSNSACINNACQCPAGYLYSSSATSCLKVATTYGESCEESIQCSRYLFNGATCRNNICVCSEGHYYMHGKCNAYSGLFGPCHKDRDCYVNAEFGATFCDNGVCKCSPGFYQREYRTCRPEAKAVGEKCYIDNDCTFSNTAYCDGNECAVGPRQDLEFWYNYNEVQRSFMIRSDADLGQKCTTDNDCTSIQNAICAPSKTCTCKRAHFFMEEKGKCVPELGEPCDTTEIANIQFSECRNGVWNCERTRVARIESQNCPKALRKLQFNCQFDEQCSIFGPDASCNGEVCVCSEKSRFIESELFCWTKKGFDEHCQRDIDCYIDGINTTLTCKNNICSCPDGTHLNTNRTNCIESSAGLDMACEETSDCSVKNSICSNEVCVCADGYYASNKDCVAGINATCTGDNDCTVENSECTSDRCSCKDKHVATSVNTCVSVASYGDPCEHDLQCAMMLPNTACVTRNSSKICDCAKGYHYALEECLENRVLGMRCERLSECYLVNNKERVVCKNNKCACDWGYIRLNDTVCGIDSGSTTYNNSNRITITSGGLLSILYLVLYILK